MRYFDAHCHIQFDQFDDDRHEVLASMEREEVGGLVVGCDLESSKNAVALAEKYDFLWASIGLHPNRESNEAFDAAAFRELAAHPKVVAIGECGLDYYRPEVFDEETKRVQKEILNVQIELAASLDKALVIHSRPTKGTQDAYQDLIGILTLAKKKYPSLRGDIHFFVGGVAEMQALTELGFTVSYTGVITFSRDYDEPVRRVPLAHILTETDAPYAAPKSRRGKKNDPLSIPEIVTALAEIRGEEREKVREAALSNALKIFGLEHA